MLFINKYIEEITQQKPISKSQGIPIQQQTLTQDVNASTKKLDQEKAIRGKYVKRTLANTNLVGKQWKTGGYN